MMEVAIESGGRKVVFGGASIGVRRWKANQYRLILIPECVSMAVKVAVAAPATVSSGCARTAELRPNKLKN